MCSQCVKDKLISRPNPNPIARILFLYDEGFTAAEIAEYCNYNRLVVNVTIENFA